MQDLFQIGVLPKYFSSEWSFAQYRLPEETTCKVAFGPQRNSIIIICKNGRYARTNSLPHSTNLHKIKLTTLHNVVSEINGNNL